ncbi:MAG: hypothetical protein KDD19_05640, partial [Phaeodactylibacter sp.]|nr:hypothetical protein [Phaeodactylibacter sp.]
MEQDKRGFLWVLNARKLHRFDGRNFVVYPPPTDTSGSKIELIFLDPYHDSLLLLLSPSHLYLFEPKAGQWQSFPVPAPQGRKAVLYGAGPLENGDYGVYLFSENRDTLNVYAFNGQRFDRRLHQNIPGVYWKSPLLLPDGQLLLYQHTIEKHSPDERMQPRVFRTPSPEEGGLMNISPAAHGMLVVLKKTPATDQVFNWDPETGIFTFHPANRFLPRSNLYLSATLPVADGSLWLCGRDRNLAYYDAAQDTLFDFSATLKEILPNVNDIVYPFIDKTGTVWIVTQLGMLKVALPEKAFSQYLSKTLPECNGYCSLRGMAQSPQGEVFAAYYHGIARIDPVHKGVRSFYTSGAYPIPLPSGLYADEHGLWLN